MDQNNDSSSLDQIQSPQYPRIHHPSQADVEEVLHDREKFMQDTQTFLEKFNRFSFGFTPRVLMIAWERIDKIKEYLEKSPDAVTTVLPNEEPKYSSSMGYEHSNTTPETESDEIIKSGVEELVPILSENEVISEDKRECDVPIFENSTIFDDHYEIFSNSKNDDDISSEDDNFEDIEYVEASLSDPEIVSIAEENVVYHEEEENVVNQEEEEIDLEDISQIQDVDLREKLLSMTRLIANIESLNDKPTPDRVLNSSVSIPIFEESDNFPSDQERLINVLKNDISDNSTSDPLLEEADLFLASDNSIPPGIENFANDSKGDIRFLEELLIDDSILSHESSDSNFEDNPSVSLPPPEPPNAEFDFKPDSKEDIPGVINDKDKFDDDYSSFMFVIRSKMFLSFLSAESEDTIFDPGISI
uniref:Reverse transcriptase domain-containing protein n=1 Tax=Tanacetum cinerariifolium TaxID=118510 RepID=A0A6L2L569_TANCI|nr:hypothetical protein [Tanacetum cinerariifolium]